MQHRTKVLVIGLDGATWNIIKPLVEERKLPAIEKLMHKGCYGDLESCIPPITFPAWKCYSTGKNPGKLGAYCYYGIDQAWEKFVFHNSTSFRSKELWDYLGENNIACGVLDMPTTYPCREINGFMISHGSPSSSGYAYPPDLERELAERFDYKIEPEYSFRFSNKDASISSTKSIIKQRFEVAGYLLKKLAPPFFHLTIFNIDQIQHNCWREMEEGETKYGTAIEDSWILIDKGIKELLESCDEDTYVILMSDHGFTGRKGTFLINKWLLKRDLLKLKRSELLLSGLPFGLGFIKTKLLRAVGSSKLLLSLIRSLIPKATRQKIAGSLPEVDWEKTKVIPVGDALCINRNAIDSEQEYEKLRNSLIAEIKEMKDPQTGEKLAKEVYKREEIYSGSYVEQAPDITILTNEGYGIAGGNARTDRWTGVHKLQGIFLACGPGIKKGVEIQGARIYDLAPTILYLFDSAIPTDMDGRVLGEIFEEDSALAKREARCQEVDEEGRVKVSEEGEEPQPFTKEDEEKVKARLRALGYLD